MQSLVLTDDQRPKLPSAQMPIITPLPSLCICRYRYLLLLLSRTWLTGFFDLLNIETSRIFVTLSGRSCFVFPHVLARFCVFLIFRFPICSVCCFFFIFGVVCMFPVFIHSVCLRFLCCAFCHFPTFSICPRFHILGSVVILFRCFFCHCCKGCCLQGMLSARADAAAAAAATPGGEVYYPPFIIA